MQVITAKAGSCRMPEDAVTEFVVGQDREGHWVACEIHGWGGGWFRSREDALHYAAFQSDHRPGAVRVSGEVIEVRL